MSTFLRRGLLVLGLSTIVGVAFVPLGDSGWAEGIRAEQAEPKSEASQSREEPPLVIRVVAPVVKVTLLMGIPAMFVVSLAAGARRLRR